MDDLEQPVKDEAVSLRAYDSSWPEQFRLEAAALEAAIGPWITGGVNHVGSTAMPGMTAKPVIDIMVGVAGLDESRPCIELLAALDYCYAPYRDDVMHLVLQTEPGQAEPSSAPGAYRLGALHRRSGIPRLSAGPR